MTALYLHIPFCRSKCHYCSFSSCANAEPLYEPYIAALMREMDNIAGQDGIAGGDPGPPGAAPFIPDCCQPRLAT